MDLQIQGKTALVTGASAGIGQGIAIALGREGVRLAIAGRRREALEETASQVEAAGGPSPSVITAEFMDEDAAKTIAEAASAALGPVEILINNAGGSRPFDLDASEDDWYEAMTLNFTRHRQLTRLLLDPMIAAGWGRIVYITGKSEPTGINGAFAAKAAVHAWAKGLSRVVGRHGITVNCIPPGQILSDQIRRNYSPEVQAQMSAEEIPAGRFGEPADIANLVAFLCSPLAGYINGAVIPVDGGQRRYQF
jgi:3-oxoacyl-[acyl-carrier protein] reductase